MRSSALEIKTDKERPALAPMPKIEGFAAPIYWGVAQTDDCDWASIEAYFEADSVILAPIDRVRKSAA
jgi:hypothetical protein